MGYMDNSYSNSNNGGSVNSQDSLWQMKMAAGSNSGGGNSVPGTGGTPDHHHRSGVGGGQYGYDPLTHGGYGTVDDYAPYPHITSSPGDMDYQQRPPGGSVIPQRQDYGSDPYAAVHKPKKRMDQHIGKSETFAYMICQKFMFQKLYSTYLYGLTCRAIRQWVISLIISESMFHDGD
jgi:echinoid protein